MEPLESSAPLERCSFSTRELDSLCRALRGELPAKFKGDATRYVTNLRRESLLIVVCCAIWSVKDIAEVLWLRADDVADSGAGPVLWGIIGVAGLWLGLLGVAMAVGLARILRSGAEVPEDYWRTLVNY